VFQGGVQIAQYVALAAAGSPAELNWLVFNFTLTATPSGQVAITPIQQFAASAPSSRTAPEIKP
jgi:hypothetical protein